ALRLPAAQRASRPIKRQIVQANRAEISQSGMHLFEHHATNRALGVRQFQAAKKCEYVADFHRAYLGDVAAADLCRQRLGLEPAAIADWTHAITSPAAQKDANMHLVPVPLQPIEESP